MIQATHIPKAPSRKEKSVKMPASINAAKPNFNTCSKNFWPCINPIIPGR